MRPLTETRADRVGIGWREPLAAAILANLDKIDIIEVLADDYIDLAPRRLAQLRMLTAQAPVTLHGTTMGLASTAPAPSVQLEPMARLVDAVRPESWTEHLAFVRAGAVEIGHLAAPPRNPATVEATARNWERATSVVGMAPHLENVATLIDPPGSSLSDAEWTAQVVQAGSGSLLLDLHNVITNACNLGYAWQEWLEAIDFSRVQYLHIAGGQMLPEGRLLDDHLHDVPDQVFELLEAVAERAAQPLTVILERDGCYPKMKDLLQQLDRARAALAKGRKHALAVA